MAYKNYMEDVVVGELNEILKQVKGVCGCERCREDMVAYALNRLPSKYVVTALGGMYTRLNQLMAQSKADTTVQLLGAVKVVRENPRH